MACTLQPRPGVRAWFLDGEDLALQPEAGAPGDPDGGEAARQIAGAPQEYDLVARGAGAQNRGVLLAGSLDQDLFAATDPGPVDLAADPVLKFVETVQPFLLHGLGQSLAFLPQRADGARPRRVPEGKGVVEADLADQIEGFL